MPVLTYENKYAIRSIFIFSLNSQILSINAPLHLQNLRLFFPNHRKPNLSVPQPILLPKHNLVLSLLGLKPNHKAPTRHKRYRSPQILVHFLTHTLHHILLHILMRVCPCRSLDHIQAQVSGQAFESSIDVIVACEHSRISSPRNLTLSWIQFIVCRVLTFRESFIQVIKIGLSNNVKLVRKQNQLSWLAGNSQGLLIGTPLAF